MKNIFKLSGILFFVAMVSAGILAFYSGVTAEKIAELAKAKQGNARKYVMGKASKFVKVENSKETPYFRAEDNSGNCIGYVFLAKENGFSGVVKTMVGVDKDFNIVGIKVIKHSETPGLGAKVGTINYGEVKPYFEERFQGKSAFEVIPDKDDPASKNKIESLTGATITTRAVCKSITKYSKIIKNELK